MVLGITNNISALNTQRNLNLTNRQLGKSLEKLSSGYRINVGADGPADLVISEQLRAQNMGLERAVRNTQEAMNVLGIAEGALNEMNEILKKMRALALHAANNGITSPSQIAADQAEMDSGIQTIDRIAATTKYSDQFLLNGSKGILFDRNTVKGNALLDLSYTRIDQVFKREGTVESLSYAGSVATGDAANMAIQATRGFVEAGASSASRAQIDADSNEIKADQRFIITGSKGSREFSFAEGTDLSAIASAINNVSGSTGVEANLALAAAGVRMRAASSPVMGFLRSGTDVGNFIDYDAPASVDIVTGGQSLIFGQTLNPSASGIRQVIWHDDPKLGMNTDGHGRVYVQWTGVANGSGVATVRLYKGPKDEGGSFRAEDLVAEGSANFSAANTVTFSERNGSGMNGRFTINGPGNPVFADADADGVGDDDIVLLTHTLDASPAGDRQARLDWTGEDGGWRLNLQAQNAGADGNNISVELVDPGVAGASLNASMETLTESDGSSAYRIKVSLATDASGKITSTDTDVMNALNNGGGGGVAVGVLANMPTLGGVIEARSTAFLSGGIEQGENIRIDGYDNGFRHIAVSGLEVGVNTDADGKLYLKMYDDTNGGVVDRIEVYKDAAMSADSMVARFHGGAMANIGNNATAFLDERNDSGLRIAFLAGIEMQSIPSGTSTWSFDMGLRMSSTDYGASEFVRVEALEGSMWDVHAPDRPGADARGYVNLDSSEGFITMESRGSGAKLAVNGQEIFTDGLVAEAATPDFNGHLVFREGMVGKTTIAQVGYERAISTTAIGQMSLATNMAVNAGTDAREDLRNFRNGMQLQLGEGQGDQERTVYGIQSMAVATLGKVRFTDDFGSGEQTTKTLTLSDVLGGGFASLAVDPVKALTVIDQAINDVTGLRARLGAAQSNLLQTNANSLSVAIENITKTESAIRDADMAAESTDFTKNQILVQAGVGMLAQANVGAQSVMQLIQG